MTTDREGVAGLTLARPSTAALAAFAAIAGLVVAALLVGQTSLVGLLAVGLVLAVAVGLAAVRWPRPVIVAVVLSPVLDRYILADWLPAGVARMANFLSEGLLLTVSLALVVVAVRQGRLVAAIWHPATAALAVLTAIALLSAVLNAVPPHIGALGLLLTIDAAACFYLPRLAGFGYRDSLIAVGAILAVVGIAALAGLAQALLAPDLFGLTAWHGRYGEVYRLAAIFSDPNTFGAFLIAGIPFAAFAMTSLRGRARWVSVGLAVLLFVPLYLSFSRGAWGGLVVGGGLALALVSFRTLAVAVLVGALSFGVAAVSPRWILLDLAPPPAPGESPAPTEPSLVDSTVNRVNEIGRGKDLRTLYVVNALPILADHPLVGVGPGRYGGATASLFGTPVYERYGTDALFEDPRQTTVDNFWLHLVVEFGVLGAAAYVAAAAATGIPVILAARRATGLRRVLLGGIAGGTAAVAANSVTTMLLEANSLAFVTWFLLGVGSVVVAGKATLSVAPAPEPAPAATREAPAP